VTGGHSLPEPSTLRALAAQLPVDLGEGQAQTLCRYAALLVKWNAVYNLTSIERHDQVLSLHLLDSLAIVPHIVRETAGRAVRVLDVGSGGGLPGIPLAIALASAHVTVTDKVQKKIAFLRQVKLELLLNNVEVVRSRVENWDAPQGFDVVTARAFAPLAELVRLTRHLCAPTGFWAAMKGAHPADEINELPAEVEVFAAIRLRVPSLAAERHLILIRPVIRPTTRQRGD